MEKCLKEGEIATLKSEVRTLFNEVKELRKVYDIMYELSLNVAVLADQMSDVKSDIKGIKDDVEEIKKQPIKEYQHYKSLIIGAIITAIIGAFMAGKLL